MRHNCYRLRGAFYRAIYHRYGHRYAFLPVFALGEYPYNIVSYRNKESS